MKSILIIVTFLIMSSDNIRANEFELHFLTSENDTVIVYANEILSIDSSSHGVICIDSKKIAILSKCNFLNGKVLVKIKNSIIDTIFFDFARVAIISEQMNFNITLEGKLCILDENYLIYHFIDWRKFEIELPIK